MIVLKYIITFILGIISASFIVIVLTVLRCGIPFCKAIVKEPDVSEDKKQSSKKIIKKYYLSLLIDFSIITILSLLVYFPMKETFIFYLILIGFYTLISFSKTGKTTENLLEVNNALGCNVDYNNSETEEIDLDKEIITELMNKSGLSENICTDIYSILSSFQCESKEKGLEKIKNLLIPDLRNEGNYGNVGIAFGMLINDEIGLTKEESIKYASDFMLEMVGEKNESN